MAKLLYIESSPRKDRSASIAVAHEFIQAYSATHPDDHIETLDLWSFPLPEFDGDIIEAKYRILHGQNHTSAEAEAWKAVVKVFERFNAADKYLFSLPMWNFEIPYKLKHFIDIITQPGLSFSFSPQEGYKGLVTGKPAAVIYARGGEYKDANVKALDFQKPYFETWLGFIGFSEVHPIVVEPTLGQPESVEQVKTLAKELAVKIGKSF